jgi:hypothetical protein
MLIQESARLDYIVAREPPLAVFCNKIGTQETANSLPEGPVTDALRKHGGALLDRRP